ncbi:MAG TPA: transglycosylase domain-containing protein [Rhodoglobus sp.]|nr:transglycosylase domain-containing protein [Rhodoglobus sp.]
MPNQPPRRGAVKAAAGFLGFSALSGLLVTVLVAPAIAVTGVTASSAIGVFDSLPEYLELGRLPERNEIYANSVNGPQRIAVIYNQNREEVAYEQISQYALDAAVDGEDRRFFEHGGVDVAGVVRAAVGNLGSGDIESGASTLSMQVVKNTFVQQALELPTEEERDAAYEEATATSFERKLKEMKLAIGLEKKYTKKEILVAYLNLSNFGSATYGIQAAAQRYFNVNASDLTPAQAASLVSIVQYPNQRKLDDPENFAENQLRRDYILHAMFEAGHLTQEEYDTAIATPVDETFVNLQPPNNGCRAAVTEARWFCDYVVKSVDDFAFLGDSPEERRAAWKTGGYKLFTTLDLDIQWVAQNAVWAYAPNNETGFALGSASTSVEPGTGRVLTMAENKIFDDDPNNTGIEFSAVNYNTDFDHGGSSGIQPGSTYKLFTLLSWLEAGKGVNERLLADASRWNFRDFTECGARLGGGTFPAGNASNERGIYTVREGTVQSINGIFFRMAQQLDLCTIRDTAARLGVVRADGEELQTNPTSIIGTNEVTPLSMAGAYATVSALGKYCKPIIVDSIITPEGEEAPGQPQECKQVLDPGVAATAVDVLKRVMNVSNTAYANPEDGVPIFGKTGTTDFSNQTWMASATSKIANVVWVGNSVGEYDITDAYYNGTRGILLRHLITRDIMAKANELRGGDDWPEPPANLLQGSGAAVPDGLIGVSLDQARAIIEGAGFQFADGGQVDSDLPAGVVASTNPAPGTMSAKGATVTVFTSKGNLKPFPDVVGQDADDAEAALNGAGYANVDQQCVVLTPSSGTGPVTPADPRIDKVQSTDPAAGAATDPAATDVTLAVGRITC